MIPLVQELLGQEYVIYSSAYIAVQLVLIWTHCKNMICEEDRLEWKKVFLNVNIISIIVGVILFICRIQLPSGVQDVMDMMNNMIGPIGMLLAGMVIADVPYKKRKVGIVTTGNEVFYGRIKDTFTPVIIEKMKSYGAEIHGHILCNDDMEKITAAIMKLKEEGADLIVCTGGMSVDPDDKTPGAIKNTGARIVSYGAPVLPGAMFLLSYLEDGTPVMGLPGCVMYAKATVFDLVLPRIIAGIEVTKKDLAHMGNGGFCLGCKECHYPNCSFGKGV